MGLFDKWKKTETRSNGSDAILVTPTTSASGSLSFGSLFINGSAMGLSAVYRAVDMISDSVAVLPIQIQNQDGKVINHLLDYVINDRNARLTKYQLIKLMLQSVMMRGNGFAYIERNGDGSAKKLRYLEAGDVTIQYNKIKNELYYQCAAVSPKRIEPVNMIHLVKCSYDGVNGISVLNYASNSISNAKYTEQSALDFYKKGCNLAGVIKVQSSLTPQQITDIKSSWNTTYSQGGNGVAVLQGNMDYSPVQVNAADALMLESRKYNVEDIARFFGINPILLGDNTGGSQYGTISALQTEYVMHTLLPYITMVEEEFTRKLFKPSESALRINLDETYLLKGDKTTEAQYWTALAQSGIVSINEARTALGFEKRDNCDDLIIPYTNVAASTVGKTEDKN